MALKASSPIVPITGLTSVSLKTSLANFNGSPCMVRIQPLQSSFLGNGVRALQVNNSSRLRCNGLGGGSLGSGMNLFSRFVRIIKSYTNAILFYFEDPVKILDHAVDEMNQDLLTMRRTTAQVLASQKQLENKFEAARRASDHWQRRAQVALVNKDENLALEALKRRKNFDDTAKSLKAQLDQLKSVVENIISKTRLLESKIHEAKSKNHVLKARATTAKTAEKLRGMLENVNGNSALSVFERMEEKVLTMEVEAEMINQLTTNDLDEKFAMLEGSSVYDELEELKKDLPGSSTKGGEMPPGITVIAAGTGSPFRNVEIEKQLSFRDIEIEMQFTGTRHMMTDF